MNVFTNEEYFKGQLQSAQKLQRLGIGSIIIAFLVSCPTLFNYDVPAWVIVAAYPFLLSGFPLWTIGNGRLRRLRSGPRPDQLLSSELKGLNNKYSLHHYVLLNGKVVKHMLVGPAGLIVMETRDTVGAVSCAGGPKGDHWKVPSGIFNRLTGNRFSIGNPSQDVAVAVAQANELVAGIGKPKVHVTGLIVFTRQRDLDIDGCTFQAVPLGEVKQAVKSVMMGLGSEREDGSAIETMLTSEDRRRINTRLAPPQPAAPKKPASAQR